MVEPNEPRTATSESAGVTRRRTRRAVLGSLVSGGLAATAGCLDAGDASTAGPDRTTSEPGDDATPTGTPTDTEGARDTETSVDPATIGVPFEVDPGGDPDSPEQTLDVNGLGLDTMEWDRYGQSFTVERGFGSVDLYATNYGDDGSAFEMTVHRGEPGTGAFEEIQWEWIQGFEDDSWIGVDVDADEAGTYYVEMADPVGFSSWNWRTESPPAVGGSAYFGREARDDGLFIFRVDE